MKLNEQWLREYVNVTIPHQELIEQLTMTGLEVESVEPVAGKFHGVVVGEIIQITAHPSAERLHVCQVNVGDKSSLTIVTGAQDVQTGLKIPVAVDGAELPNGQRIIPTLLRGVESQGMLCSAVELGLAETSTGILHLPLDAPVGEDLRQWLKLDDYTLQMKLTPNRGDCLSILGIAREVAIISQTPLTTTANKPILVTKMETLAVTIEAPADCPRYIGRVIRHIDPQITTPIAIQEKLRRCGLRSINLVVDVMNYVMLEVGQPLHAFDLAKLSGSIHVRRAKSGESITLLDEQIKQLDSNTLVIADDKQAHAIAGIMGGLDSAVTSTTHDIFLESAFFDPIVIAGRARHYGFSTDASHRFERGVDPTGQLRACERATQLLLEITDGKASAGPIIEKTSDAHLPKRSQILLRRQRITRILGIEVPASTIQEILQSLDMNVKPVPEGWEVVPPVYRFDIVIEVDLIEEIARIYGYHKIREEYPQNVLRPAPKPEAQISLSRLRNVLVDRGYHEAITYSFIEPRLQQLFEPHQPSLQLINPISSDMATMRTSLWPGLLSAVLYNRNRQQPRVRLFETGLRYVQQSAGLAQQMMLGGVAIGGAYPEQWGLAKRAIDFFDVKGDVETLFAMTGRTAEFNFLPATHSALHPGQTSQVLYQNKVIGYLGAIHPAIEEALELGETAYLFEFILEELQHGWVPRFASLSKFPSIRRDIAFVVDHATPVQEIQNAIKKVAGELLRDVVLFDVYQGQPIGIGKKSLALGLILQHATRTLVEDEVNEVIDKVVSTLKELFLVTIRDIQYGTDKS